MTKCNSKTKLDRREEKKTYPDEDLWTKWQKRNQIFCQICIWLAINLFVEMAYCAFGSFWLLSQTQSLTEQMMKWIWIKTLFFHSIDIRQFICIECCYDFHTIFYKKPILIDRQTGFSDHTQLLAFHSHLFSSLFCTIHSNCMEFC